MQRLFFILVAFFILNSMAHAAPAAEPKTGQTTSYAARDDGDLERGVAWPGQRFSDNGNGTVSDNLTGLIWLRDTNCTDTVGGITKSSGNLSWANALTWSNNISSGRCGLSDGSRAADWRLPNVDELESLVDLERYNPALPTGHPFSNVQANLYWSSSTYAYNTTRALIVRMYDGYVHHDLKTFSSYVWPVRSGQVGPLGSLSVADVNGNAIGTQVAGTPFTIKVTGYTSSGTPLTGWVTLSSYGGITPKDVYLSNGVWGDKVTLTEAATLTGITASNVSGVVGSSNSFAVTGSGGNTGSISGKVMHNFDGPVSGATVYLSPSLDGVDTFSATTDSTGMYSFSGVPAGQYYLWSKLVATGKQCRRISVAVPAGRPVRVPALVLDLYGSTDIPVVLVPGILGSSAKIFSHTSHTYPKFYKSTYHNQDELNLHDPAKGSGWRDRSPGWRDLEDALGGGQIKYVECPWDWRMPIEQAIDAYLIPAIDRALDGNPTGKVNIIAHSMGGLLVRAYIQSSGYRNDIENFSMVGTPNMGSGKAYYMWEGGDPKQADDLTDGLLDAGLNLYWSSTESLYEDVYKFGSLSSSDSGKIAKFYRDKIPTARQLLPTYGFLKHNGQSPQGITTDGNVNTFLRDLNNDSNRNERMGRPDDSGKIKTRVYYSLSEKTINTIDVTLNSDSIWTALSPLYPDGRPKGDPSMPSSSGDGTVLTGSATFPADEGWAERRNISGSHAGLIREDLRGQKLIITDMYPTYSAQSASRTMAAFGVEATPTATVSISVLGRVQPVVIDSLGGKTGVDFVSNTIVEEIPGSEALIGADVSSLTLNSLPDGTYTVALKGGRAEDYSLEISYLDDSGTVDLHRMHGFNNATTTTFSITVNATSVDRLIVNQAPQPPTGIQADAVGTTDLVTRLSWQATGETGVTGYAVYARYTDEPYLVRLGVTSGTAYDTDHPWAKDDTVKIHLYTVAAVKADGTESFLTHQVTNDDRDHDGLIDAEELIVGTDPAKADTDGDGYRDFVEQQHGSNPLEPTSAPTVTLSINKGGTGTGSVLISPGSATCGTICEPVVNLNSLVTLTATHNADSTFTGWSGACSGADDCKITLDAPKTVTATFTANPASIRIDGDSTIYYAIDGTLRTITTQGKTVFVKSETFIENVIMTSPVSILLKGGYADNGFSSRSTTSTTVIDGSLKIRKGTLRVERLVVR